MGGKRIQPDFSTPDGGRIGCSQGFYFSICVRSFGDFVASRDREATSMDRLKLVNRPGDLDDASCSEYEDVRRQRSASTASAVITIVFASMCLEAAIYDYAAWHLGDDYVQTNLDKMDLVSKWLVVPRLVAQREIPIGRPSHDHLKTLVRLRNGLVHKKSHPIPLSDEDLLRRVEELDVKEHEIQDGCIVAMRAIVLVSLDMDHLLGGVTINPLPSFARNSDTHYRARYTDELEALVSECRGMLTRSRKIKTTLAQS